MAIFELMPYDLITSRPERIYALQPFWANLASLGARSARLLVVTDHINYETALAGFNKVAVPFGELPRDLRWYRSYYEQYIQNTIRETQYMRIFLIISSVLDDTTLMRLVEGYGIQTRPLDSDGIPLPFQSADISWDTAIDENSKHWGVVQSDVNQTGAIHPRTLHKLFQIEFPTYIAIDIWNYGRTEAVQLLKTKAAVANIQNVSQKTGRAEKMEANDAQQAIDQFKREIGTVGVGLHEVRVSIAVHGNTPQTLNNNLELVRGSCPLDLEKRRAQISVLRDMFSANPPSDRYGTLATSTHIAMLSGTTLSYSRPTKTDGVLLGFDAQQSPVVINIFDGRNSAYNVTVVGQTGSGKTFFTSLLMIRSLLTGVRLIIIDPKGDMDLSWLGKDNAGHELCNIVRVGTADNSINILEPTYPTMSNQIEFSMGILKMLGVWGESAKEMGIERTLIDMALNRLYTPLWQKETTIAPTLVTLKAILQTIQTEQTGKIAGKARELAFKLIPFTEGSRANLFGQQTGIDLSLNAPVNIFDVSQFPSRQTGGAMRSALFATLFGLVNQAIVNRRQRGDKALIQFFVDEIGVLMRDPVVADYTSDKYKTARSLGISMIVADQTIASLLGVKDEQGIRHGHEMFANSPFRFIFFQEDSEMGTIQEQFPTMPDAYSRRIHNLPRGQCIAQTPQGIFHTIVTPSDLEAVVLSSNLMHQKQAKKLIKQMRNELAEGGK